MALALPFRGRVGVGVGMPKPQLTQLSALLLVPSSRLMGHGQFRKVGQAGVISSYWSDIPHRYDSRGESDLLLFCTDHNPCKEKDNPSKPGNNNNQYNWDGISHRRVLL